MIQDTISVLLAHNYDHKKESGLYVLMDLPASTPYLSIYKINV